VSTLQEAPPEAPRRLSLPVATLIGLLALAAALGVGHLVAGFVGYTASPFIAVANYVIDHSPTGIVKWAERTLGTWDKPVLKLGLAVVLGAAPFRRQAAPALSALAIGIVAALVLWG